MAAHTQTSTTTVKANIDGDVRRIQVTLPVSAADWQTFQKIRAAVADGFGLDEACLPVLKYRDEDGDLCTLVEVSVQDMLVLANGGTLHVFGSTAQKVANSGWPLEEHGYELVAAEPALKSAADADVANVVPAQAADSTESVLLNEEVAVDATDDELAVPNHTQQPEDEPFVKHGTLTVLTAMGFGEDLALAALVENNGNIFLAVDSLITNLSVEAQTEVRARVDEVISDPALLAALDAQAMSSAEEIAQAAETAVAALSNSACDHDEIDVTLDGEPVILNRPLHAEAELQTEHLEDTSICADEKGGNLVSCAASSPKQSSLCEVPIGSAMEASAVADKADTEISDPVVLVCASPVAQQPDDDDYHEAQVEHAEGASGVAMLVAMGFAEEPAVAALSGNNGNIEAAIDSLVKGGSRRRHFKDLWSTLGGIAHHLRRSAQEARGHETTLSSLAAASNDAQFESKSSVDVPVQPADSTASADGVLDAGSQGELGEAPTRPAEECPVHESTESSLDANAFAEEVEAEVPLVGSKGNIVAAMETLITHVAVSAVEDAGVTHDKPDAQVQPATVEPAFPEVASDEAKVQAESFAASEGTVDSADSLAVDVSDASASVADDTSDAPAAVRDATRLDHAQVFVSRSFSAMRYGASRLGTAASNIQGLSRGASGERAAVSTDASAEVEVPGACVAASPASTC